MKRGFTNGKLEPTKFASVHCLSSLDFVDDTRVVLYILQSLLMAYFIVKKMKITTMWEADLKILKDDPSFLSLFKFINNNNEMVCCNVTQMGVPAANGKQEGRIISYMLTPAFSFLNHSCIHMTTRKIQNEHMILTAILPIKENEQIFVNLTLFSGHDKNLRLAILSEMGHIKCNCEACINDWPCLPQILSQKPLPKMESNFIRAFLNSKSVGSQIFEYARKENKIMDFSKDLTIAAKTVEKVLKNSKINSPEAMMAAVSLYYYIFYSQRPFLTLK